MDNQNASHSDIIRQIKEALMNIDYTSASAKIQEYLDEQSNTPLNIAITGECGSGKSSFVNAFRGIRDNDDNAAPTDVVEVTTEVKPYPHPRYPNIILWDLPGIGTTKYPADKYLKLVGFEKFDFFIIISDSRFRENDVKLAKEIRKMGKKFYFARSKIDNDLRAEQRKQRAEYNEQSTMARIRENCVQGLQQQGFQSPQVFLISNFDLHLYDFALLHETLERELSEQKRHVLILAMPNISLEVINKKKKAFESQIKYYSVLSAVGAAVPVPGLSAAVDLSMIASVVSQYVYAFGLDAASLQSLSASTGVPFDDLKKLVKSVPTTAVISRDLILTLMTQLAGTAAFMVLEEESRLVPLLGIPVAMTLSFVTTYRALNYFLSKLAEEAHKVLNRALSSN